MNREPPQELDRFETALLTQLRAEVESAATRSDGPVLADRGRRRRWYVPAAASAAAVVAGALVAQAVWPTPAYAVSGRNGGKVTVQVMRLEGAEQLERELARRGIPADITYLPDGKQCAPGRYTAVRTPGMMLGVSADEFEVTIPPRAVGSGDTFVLSASVKPIKDGFSATVDFDIAHGKVAGCRVVDAP